LNKYQQVKNDIHSDTPETNFMKRSKNRILIVTTDFPPSTTIGTQRILKICKYLSDDWDIHILTLKKKYFPHSNHSDGLNGCERKSGLKTWRTAKLDLYSFLIGIKKKLAHNRGERDDAAKKNGGVSKGACGFSIGKTIRRMGGVVTDMLEFPDPDISWTPISTLKGLVLSSKYDIDLVFASAPRHSNLMTVLLLKKLTGKKMVVDFRDPWARSPWLEKQRHSTASERLKHRLVQILERKVVEHADRVVFTTENLRDEFADHYSNMAPYKFISCYNGYDPERLRDSGDENKDRVGRKKVVFSHIGSLYKKRSPENLMLALHELLRQGKIDPDCVLFRFIGNVGRDLGHVEKMVSELRLGDVLEFVPPVSYAESLEHMAESDVLIVLQPGAKLMLPAKVFDYLCFGKPMLAVGEKDGEVDKVVDGKFGVFVDNENLVEIGNGIMKLAKDPDRYQASIKSNRTIYDVTKSIQRFEKILDSALDRNMQAKG
jgi:glycosyltransferase involved in cell wall biosynthesis